MILPLRVFGSSGVKTMFAGFAIGPILSATWLRSISRLRSIWSTSYQPGTSPGFPVGIRISESGNSAVFSIEEANAVCRHVEDEGLIVIANRGVQRGAEMHDNTNHVFIIVDGEAEFVTGGKMVDPKVTAPGQTRGTGIEGGVSHHLTKGDVITIPAKTPHQWKDTSKTGSIGYYAVNFDSN